MFLRKLFFVVGFFLLAGANCHATTVAEECQKRAMSAYDNGMTDDQKLKLGALAASECFKEMEESLKKNGSSSVVGPIILLLVIGGFLAYKLATKGDKPLSKMEIGNLREEVRDLYKAESVDSLSVREYKQTRLEDAEKMFSSALSGDLPITANSMKGAM